MSDALGPPGKILAVVDGGHDEIALQSAAALADRHGAALEVIACFEPPRDIGVVARLEDRAPDQLLDDLCDRHQAAIQATVADCLPGREVGITLRRGKTFVEVIRHVMATDADFVVKVAAPLTGVHRFLFASTDQHLLRKCPCPVWLQTTTATVQPKQVLAAVDVDDWDAAEPETLFSLNRRVIEMAKHIAAPVGAQITVLHAWEAIGDGMVWAFSSKGDARLSSDAYVNDVIDARRRAMNQLIAAFPEKTSHGSEAKLIPRLVRGSPERVIQEQSREIGADVVVMGTVARTGLSGVFIGNTAEDIINNLDCPVLAVKPSGFVSPLAAGPGVMV